MTNSYLTKLSIAAALCTGGALGCAGKSVDIGDDQPAQALGQSLSDYAGQWVGYAEAQEWDDGTDSVRITLDSDGNGTLEVGEAAALPPPVLNEPYPPGSQGGPLNLPISGIVSGFSYTIEGARVESKRIKFGLASGELYDEWCGLYEPQLNTPDPGNAGEPFYSCSIAAASGWSSDGTTCWVGSDPAQEIPCAGLDCIHTCGCTETECTSLNAEAEDVELDAVLENEGAELEGTLVIPGSRVVVRMTRM